MPCFKLALEAAGGAGGQRGDGDGLRGLPSTWEPSRWAEQGSAPALGQAGSAAPSCFLALHTAVFLAAPS